MTSYLTKIVSKMCLRDMRRAAENGRKTEKPASPHPHPLFIGGLTKISQIVYHDKSYSFETEFG